MVSPSPELPRAHRPALAAIAVAMAVVAGGALGDDAAPPPDEARCTSEEDPLADLFREQQTGIDRDPAALALPKIHPGHWPPARRFGLDRLITTLYSQHAREALPVFEGRPPPPEVLRRFFRCRGFGTAVDLDPRLLEAVLAAAREFEVPRIVIISAYRSTKFNDALAKKGRRVAAESRHTSGEALDFSIPDVPATAIGAWAWERFDGGVGTYAADGFVHIDVGAKRRWNGK
jgi:hypothetical protein